ncbi:hypothetical protein E4U55_003267 [Claviceps digitariae]|nr:hypothetical protein E4U55_003267 [Claviceps digitariae]
MSESLVARKNMLPSPFVPSPNEATYFGLPSSGFVASPLFLLNFAASSAPETGDTGALGWLENMPHDRAATESSTSTSFFTSARAPNNKFSPRPSGPVFGVWFPEGYWAERQPISTPRAKSTASSRFWKWKTRSSRKSASETEARELHISPTASVPSPFSNLTGLSAPPVASPYLSESAHVLSLQNPTGETGPLGLDKSAATTPESKEATVKTGEDPTLTRTRRDSQLPLAQPSGRSVDSKEIDSKGINLSKIDDYFLIPPGISSQPLTEHDKVIEFDTSFREEIINGGVIENLEELEVGCGPAKAIPWSSFWSGGLGKRKSRLKVQMQLSEFTRKFLKRPRFQSRSSCRSLCSMTKSRRSSGGTNKVALLNTSQSTNSELLAPTNRQPSIE